MAVSDAFKGDLLWAESDRTGSWLSQLSAQEKLLQSSETVTAISVSNFREDLLTPWIDYGHVPEPVGAC